MYLARILSFKTINLDAANEDVLDATVLSDLAAIDQIMFSFLPFIVISGLIITVSYVAKLEGKITGAAKYWAEAVEFNVGLVERGH